MTRYSWNHDCYPLIPSHPSQQHGWHIVGYQTIWTLPMMQPGCSAPTQPCDLYQHHIHSATSPVPSPPPQDSISSHHTHITSSALKDTSSNRWCGHISSGSGDKQEHIHCTNNIHDMTYPINMTYLPTHTLTHQAQPVTELGCAWPVLAYDLT